MAEILASCANHGDTLWIPELKRAPRITSVVMSHESCLPASLLPDLLASLLVNLAGNKSYNWVNSRFKPFCTRG